MESCNVFRRFIITMNTTCDSFSFTECMSFKRAASHLIVTFSDSFKWCMSVTVLQNGRTNRLDSRKFSPRSVECAHLRRGWVGRGRREQGIGDFVNKNRWRCTHREKDVEAQYRDACRDQGAAAMWYGDHAYRLQRQQAERSTEEVVFRCKNFLNSIVICIK